MSNPLSPEVLRRAVEDRDELVYQIASEIPLAAQAAADLYGDREALGAFGEPASGQTKWEFYATYDGRICRNFAETLVTGLLFNENIVLGVQRNDGGE